MIVDSCPMAKTVVHSTADEKRPVNLIVPVKETGETVNERKTYYDLAGQDLASWSGYASNMNNILAEVHRLAQATKSVSAAKIRAYKHDCYGCGIARSLGMDNRWHCMHQIRV